MPFIGDLEPNASELRVEKALQDVGVATPIHLMPEPTTTAQMAADAMRVDVARIVKSLCFQGKQTEIAQFIMVSGANRVHERRTGKQVGEALRRANPDFVKAATGYSIGGVCPFGHPQPLSMFMDETLMTLPTLWLAAGSARSMVEMEPARLLEITQAKLINVL